MEQQKGKRVMPDPEGGRRRKSGRPPRVVVGVLIFLLLLCAGYAGMCAYAATSGKLLPNTRISGIQVGSLTREQAEAKLEAELPAKLSALSADFTCNGTAFTVSGDTLSADISGAVDAAWVSVSSPLFWGMRARWRSSSRSPRRLPPLPRRKGTSPTPWWRPAGP